MERVNDVSQIILQDEYILAEVKEVHKNKRDYILVKYFDPKLPHFESTDFESIEFPIEDLDRRIEHYDSKVRNLKNKNNGESK